jgi:hypothetical protein
MPIHHSLPEMTAFEPDALAAMVQAFEGACASLHVVDGDDRGREIIATRVIDLARGGVIDADALRDRVIAEAGVAA